MGMTLQLDACKKKILALFKYKLWFFFSFTVNLQKNVLRPKEPETYHMVTLMVVDYAMWESEITPLFKEQFDAVMQ